MLIRSTIACLLACFALSAGADDSATAPSPAYNPDFVPEVMPNDIPYGTPISLERAFKAISAGFAEAQKRNWKLNMAVVDVAGQLVAFSRMDGAQWVSIDIAQHKARAAAGFRRETKYFEKAVNVDHIFSVITLDRVIASRGGIPIIEDGKVIGGVGCSGGTGSQDEVICRAMLDGLK